MGSAKTLVFGDSGKPCKPEMAGVNPHENIDKEGARRKNEKSRGKKRMA